MENVNLKKGDTWPKILKYNFEKYGRHRRAMRHKHLGVWQPHTWADYYTDVKYMALGLLSLGFEAGDKVIIIGDNAPQWYCAALAAQANHGVTVGLFSDLLPQEIKAAAQNCEASFAVVEGQEQVDKLLQIKDELPRLKKIVFWNYKGLAHYKEPYLAGYREVTRRGESWEAEHPGAFEKNVADGRADDVCAVVYTAGTSEAGPRGALHSYRTLMAGAEYLMRLDPWNENDNLVPNLPPVWITEQWIGIGCHLLSAGTLNFAEAFETQQRDSRETSPSVVCYGARMWESQAAEVHGRILGADALKRNAFRLLMPIGSRAADLRYRRQEPGAFFRLLYFFADRFMFKAIRNSLGLSNARICYATGARLSPEAFRFYHALNVPLKSIYGTTEGGALAGAGNHEIHFDTVGPANSAADVRIGPAGELVYRQPGVFLGYYNDPQQTATVLKDGWFHSGDCVRTRDDGHLVYVDRIASIVTLSGGDTLAPQFVESRLRFSPYIKDAWVMAGPDGAYVSAVIVIDYNNVSRWAGQNKVTFTSFAELSQTPEVYRLVREDIQRVNQTLPPACNIRKFVNLNREFDPDEGELTRSRNLRRTVLKSRCRDLVAALYREETAAPVRARAGAPEGRPGAVETTLLIESVEGAG